MESDFELEHKYRELAKYDSFKRPADPETRREFAETLRVVRAEVLRKEITAFERRVALAALRETHRACMAELIAAENRIRRILTKMLKEWELRCAQTSGSVQ